MHTWKLWINRLALCVSKARHTNPIASCVQDFIVSNADGRTAGPELTDLVVGFLRDREYTVG
jgi:hypothetical protein